MGRDTSDTYQSDCGSFRYTSHVTTMLTYQGSVYQSRPVRSPKRAVNCATSLAMQCHFNQHHILHRQQH